MILLLRKTFLPLVLVFAVLFSCRAASAQTSPQPAPPAAVQSSAETPAQALARSIARQRKLEEMQLVPMKAGPTLAKVRAAKALSCGVDFEEVEYTTADAHGNHSLFDLDLCKAIAVAVLGPGAEAVITSYRDETDALKGLRLGEIDVLATGSPNLANTAYGYGFSQPVFYDYQGFLVNKTMGIHTPKDLAGKKTCFIDGFEIANQIQGYMPRAGIKWIPFPFQEEGEMETALVTGNCAAVSADVSQLAFERIAFRGIATNFEILPDVIANDPLSITYRLDDPQWALLMNWVPNALVQAEESGVTQSNVASMKSSQDPVIQRLLGTHKGWGSFLALNDDWAANMIDAVGNYGELFERTLGSKSLMHLARGDNNLSTKGGLMIAQPMR